MKLEPFVLLGAAGATSVATAVRGDPMLFEFMGALFSGSVLAMLFSLWKSRQRKADGVDTALWAMIALIGSWALAFFCTPMLAGREVLGIVLHKPALAFIIAVSATPVIEWLLTGEAFKWARRFLPKGEA